jgi:uncharacterized protein YjbI with pentapeptide repeats
MTDQDHIDRIDALTRNARNTWFTLLAALVFVSVTLMGVEHIDFYGVDRATKLPLVGVEVPTRYFFVAAPILIAAIYGYFHLYLIRLWDALSTAPPHVEGKRLGDAIAPWLITDAALHYRRKARGDDCTTPRTLESGAMVLNFLLTWGFGLVILLFLWTMSWPARTFWMTSIAGVSYGVSIVSGASSLAMMVRWMNRAPSGVAPNLWGTWAQIIGMAIGTLVILFVGYQKTAGPIEKLAPLSMANENIVEKPAGWLPPDIARADFLAVWCRREDVKDCKALGDLEADFDKEWKTRCTSALADMRRPNWTKSGSLKYDLRDADLSSAFLSGADLENARMQQANLSEAQLEGTNFTVGQLQGAILIVAQMQGADLTRAQLQRAVLTVAQMEGANLRRAQLQGAYMFEAQMQRADLSRTQMQGADLTRAQMQAADLFEAQLQGAILIQTQMQAAALHYTQVTGARNRPSILKETNLSMATNNGGMLRFVDLRPAISDKATDFRNTFLDGTVTMTEAFRVQMGDPCQWVKEPLEDAEFYARWRGWIYLGKLYDEWENMSVPDHYRDITPILPPPPGCEWKTGPMLAGGPE